MIAFAQKQGLESFDGVDVGSPLEDEDEGEFDDEADGDDEEEDDQ